MFRAWFQCGLVLAFVLTTAAVFAQRKITTISVEAGNAITALPFVGAPQLFYSNYHPFVTVGGRMIWKQKRKHAWEQTFNVGYIYHRFVQHSIPLFTETIYRHNMGRRIDLRVHLGLGYLQSIPDTERFELNQLGQYERVRSIGRAQGMAKLSFSGTCWITPDLSMSLNYGVLLQGPFVESYVPALPYNTIQLGVQKVIAKKRRG